MPTLHAYRTSVVALLTVLGSLTIFPRPLPAQLTLHVSPAGNDQAVGTAAAPFATLERARDAVRELKRDKGLPAGGVRIVLHGGTYPRTAPLMLTPEDSGTAKAPVVYTGATGATPVVSGGMAISRFRRNPDGSWSATVDAACRKQWDVRQLFIDNRRYILARSPNRGQFFVRKAVLQGDIETKGDWAGKSKTAFGFFPGDLKAWPQLGDVNLKLYFSWNSGLYPLKSVDERGHVALLAGPAMWPMPRSAGQCYLVENHPGALDAPGEWQLDRATGRLSVIPFAGENLAQLPAVAPVAERLVIAQGDAEQGRFVEHIRFEGISFQHGAWHLPREGHGDPQAESTLSAALEFDAARHIAIERCEVAHVGNYAIWFRAGCVQNRVVANHLHDLGGGGVRIGAHVRPTPATLSHDNLVDNNFIHDGGHVHPGAVGICVGYAHHNTLSHNEVCDFRYTGISLGWTWDIVRSGTRDNLVEQNHVHHVMRVLDDGGGVYSLGLTPGSVIRNNHIHHVGRPEDGVGHGVYLDGGSAGVLAENNVVHDTGGGGIRVQHGTACLTVMNNICAYCGFGLGADSERTNIFAYNIVYLAGEGTPFRPVSEWQTYNKIIRNNLYWDEDRRPIRFLKYTFPEWQKLEGIKDIWYTPRMDQGSRIADPQFVDARGRYFRLKPTSPALAMGFEPIDLSGAGLYGEPAWVRLPKQTAIKPLLATEEQLGKGYTKSYADGFEADAPGEKPALVTIVENEKGYVSVSDRQAATGKHSLEFVHVPGPTQGSIPHIYFQPNLSDSVRMRFSFDLYREPGATLYAEWRDYHGLRQIGPALRVERDGKLTLGKTPAGVTIPDRSWVHIEMTDSLGKLADGLWDLKITAQDHVLLDRKGVACDPGFASIQWLGIVSIGNQPSQFYVDNLKLETLPK
jgi:hypothetical protein